MKTIIQKCKQLAYLLRHDTEYHFDEHGWREVGDLITNHGYIQEMLDDIVATNNKQRYEYSEDKTKIRARQGHSVQVDVKLKEMTPPDILYHGTAIQYVDTILREGIVKKKRLYVHLSQTEETARNVGKRHGEPIIIKVDARKMSEDGIKFYLSNNGVWLTDYVGIEYIS